MCGIAGIVDPNGIEDWQDDLRALEQSIRHRGPDDQGTFTDHDVGEKPISIDNARAIGAPRIAFVHRRLSILDLSPEARQPMVRDRVFISYNGEVYNYRELRAELEQDGATFRTSSDTEVVLEAYRRWGIEAVTRLRGMFALAIADPDHGKVYLARDQLGVKPLYFARRGDGWVFSSELKSFSRIRGVPRAVDLLAIREYLHFLWLASSRTGLAAVAKLAPGSWLELDLAGGRERSHRYWTPLRAELLAPRDETTDETVEHLRHELVRVVKEQLVSDVPVGAFLSGGLDSSLVVAAMQQARGGGIATYSVGYAAKDLDYDIVPNDLPYAREVSRRFGTENHEIVLAPDVAELLPTLVETLDEPLGDPAALSSYLVCRAAKRTSSVMLGGVGADELFAGYPRQRALLYGRAYRALPRWLRSGFGGAVARLPGAGRSRLAKLGRAGHKFVAAADRDPLGHYIAMESYFSSDAQNELVRGPLADTADPVPTEIEALAVEITATGCDEPLRLAMLWDLVTYLPSLNLAYTDRTSMAHGVEVRVPFLDIRLVEWTLALRTRQLVRWRRARLEGKWLLKQAAREWLPAHIVFRPKAGFGAPVRSWLRGPLVEMREELLGAHGLGGRGWFDAAAVRALQADFVAGRRDYALQLWMLMCLELWARRFIDG